MGVVAFVGGKGSPGVTTSWLVVSAVWPAERPCVAVELDGGGGDVATLFERPPSPSVSTLAAGFGRDGGGLPAHTQELPGGLRVVVCPTLPTAAWTALVEVGPELRALGAEAGVDVLVDLGRLNAAASGRPAASPALSAADLVVVVTRPSLVELAHVAGWLGVLRATSRDGGVAADVGLLLVGPGYPAAEIEAHLEVPVIGTLPLDPAGAAAAVGRGTRKPDRQPLFQAGRAVAAALSERVALAVPRQRPAAQEASAW